MDFIWSHIPKIMEISVLGTILLFISWIMFVKVIPAIHSIDNKLNLLSQACDLLLNDHEIATLLMLLLSHRQSLDILVEKLQNSETLHDSCREIKPIITNMNNLLKQINNKLDNYGR